MAVVKPLIVQVVGFQNSGKTTFVKGLLQILSKLNVSVATIKDHGHGGKPDVVDKKDSSEHIHSGAFATIVEGEGRLLLQVEKDEWHLQEKIDMLKRMNPEIIVIEGHKTAAYQKIVLLRNEADFETLKGLENILTFVSREPLNVDTNIPIWNEQYALNWLVEEIMKKITKGSCEV